MPGQYYFENLFDRNALSTMRKHYNIKEIEIFAEIPSGDIAVVERPHHREDRISLEREEIELGIY